MARRGSHKTASPNTGVEPGWPPRFPAWDPDSGSQPGAVYVEWKSIVKVRGDTRFTPVRVGYYQDDKGNLKVVDEGFRPIMTLRELGARDPGEVRRVCEGKNKVEVQRAMTELEQWKAELRRYPGSPDIARRVAFLQSVIGKLKIWFEDVGHKSSLRLFAKPSGASKPKHVLTKEEVDRRLARSKGKKSKDAIYVEIAEETGDEVSTVKARYNYKPKK
jgi:hypothetical protein